MTEGDLPVPPPRPLRVGVSTRVGGVSRGAYASLNLSLASGDDPLSVKENWHRFSRALGFPQEAVVRLRQVHGSRVVEVEGPGSGLSPEEGDALLTFTPGPVLSVTVADCFPVFGISLSTPAVFLAHAGWRGTLGGIVRECLRALRQRGIGGEEVSLLFGPGIGPCCFRVSPEVARLFPSFAVREREDGFYVDLPAANAAQAREEGVREEGLFFSGLCTSCRGDLFFSYRRDGPRSGRMAAVVQML
jgi:YfiH family protein